MWIGNAPFFLCARMVGQFRFHPARHSPVHYVDRAARSLEPRPARHGDPADGPSQIGRQRVVPWSLSSRLPSLDRT